MTAWRRYVALGDSLTEGVGDPDRYGNLRGWADRLAAALPGGVEYHNLARLGVRTRHVRESQLPRALALGPDLASVLTGMNDVMAERLDDLALADDLGAIMGDLRSAGAFVFTTCLPRSVPALRLAGPTVRRRVEARLERVSNVIREVASSHDVLCFDMEDLPRDYGADVVSIDGLHPNARGHVLIAQAIATKLSELTGTAIDVPACEDSWLTTSGRHVRWLAAAGHLRNHPLLRVAAGKVARSRSTRS